ncbi:MAG: CdaR family protein [Oscillospiraceae bacterium]|nr:CdaR family protein [Oscillospiraceae bacterium]
MRQQKQNTEPAPKKTNTLWDNRAFLMVLSVVSAILIWMIVTMYFDPQGSVTITDATVNFSYQSTNYTSLGLDIVDMSDAGNVRVQVDGNGTVIGNLTAADIMVYPQYSNVKGPGETTLKLEARIINSDYNNMGIKLTVLRPTSVRVVFDTVSEKTFPVTQDTSGITIADGFTLNGVSTVPAEVTLSGPTSELEQIASVVAPVTTEEILSDSMTVRSALELRDANGNVLTPQYTTMDNDVASVTLNVYQVRELPLSVAFINTPNNFDESSLSYSLSVPTLRVAGPAKIVGPLNELSVVAFDLGREFTFDRDYQKNIELPNGVVSLDGVSTVTIQFDTTKMASRTFSVSNLRPVNVPSTINLDVLTTVIRNVTVYGPADEMEELSADSILAQIDCQDLTVTSGQQTIPVSIQIPSSSRIFAVGNYTVQCEVTAQ